MNLNPHPRLYLGAEHHTRLMQVPVLPFLKRAYSEVIERAELYGGMPEWTFRPESHNALLIRGREVQTRIVTLLVRWQQTGSPRYREAVLQYVKQMGEWEFWSWIAMREGHAAPDAIFDLSYGENSATLAIAFDWLHSTLNDAEKELFFATIQRPLLSGLKHAKEGGAWWFGKPDSNWNTVCAGGLGMLALAFADEIQEFSPLISQTYDSVAVYMAYLESTEGAWPEGIGYWNYGMRYGFMYLLSYERALGAKSHLFDLDGVRQTLSFPLDFTPNGQPCSFGDVNQWTPMPFHYAAAERMKCQRVISELDTWLSTRALSNATWPNAAEWLCIHRGTLAVDKEETVPDCQVKLYKGLDWAVISDRRFSPDIVMTVRGGTTQVPHSHRDLLSFHLVVGDEKFIVNVGPSEYLDSTFSPRRDEIFEMTPASKNTILVNGVGVMVDSQLDGTELIELPEGKGIRLDATPAMGVMRDGPVVNFCGRLILLLDNRSILILDKAEMTHYGRMESRLHTQKQVEITKDKALLLGNAHKISLWYSSTVPSTLHQATTAPTTPSDMPATVVRWCSNSLHHSILHATLISVEGESTILTVDEHNELITVYIKYAGDEMEICLTSDLRPYAC